MGFFAESLIDILVVVNDLFKIRRNWQESSAPRTGQVLHYTAALSYV